MKILLIGEYSRLHNSLKEGLEQLGHSVVIVGQGDGFKKFPVDENIQSRYFVSGFGLFVKKVVGRLFRFDLAGVERGVRFYRAINRLGNFDIVQLINEESIKAGVNFEIFLLKRVLRNTKKLFLLSSGADYVFVNHAYNGKFKYSVLTPFINGVANGDKSNQFVLKFLSKPYKKLHDFIYDNCIGVIATDLDYHIPLIGNEKYLGLIPNPINLNALPFTNLELKSKIKIFHGINAGNYYRKGNYIFEEALQVIQEKYEGKVDVVTVTNVPYDEYISLYNDAHIIMDQVYAYDQGYNALESMAKGKVVFTGAEIEFLEHYKLNKNQVCINALPNVQDLVNELEFLIENPKEISRIGANARAFIEKHHDYISIAEKYLATWGWN